MSALEYDNTPIPLADSRKNILFFETDKLTRKLAEKMLEEFGYSIDSISDPDSPILSNIHHHAVIIGSIPHGVTCSALVQRIRGKYASWQLPILVLSEDQTTKEVSNCLEAGATDFLLKPIKWPLLQTRLAMAFKSTDFYAELHTKEVRLRKAQSMARIGYWRMKDDPSNVSFSEEFCNILDIPKNSISTYQDLFGIVHPDDQERFMAEIQMAFIKRKSFSFSHRIRMPNGQEFFVSQIGEFSEASEGGGEETQEFFVTMRDETEMKFTREKLYREKYFDTVTGLPNRTSFLENVEEAIASSISKEVMLTCFFMGLDGFKSVNDALGPEGSDKLLKIVGQRVSTTSDKVVSMSRYGNDIFSFISDSFCTVLEAEEYAASLLALVNETVELDNHTLNIKASIGISFFPMDGHDANSLIAAADTAMHAVKELGGNDFLIHTGKMLQNAKKKLKIESELKLAIENGELELYYQPQVHILTHTISGMEALIRWNHPQRGMIPPFEFIDIAEQSGLIIPMGDWIVETACYQAKKFEEYGLSNFRVGINLSAKQFNEPGFYKKIEYLVSRSGIRAENIEFEVTESSAMSDVERAINILHAIREMGAHTSMDDFGTGFSSLASLQLLPLDTLKIDRAFVKDIGFRNNAGAIAKAIITMARGLGMNTIAEGVETEAQLAFMREYQCDIIQGFYYSKPLAKLDFIKYIQKFNGPLDSTDLQKS
ncbi:MAG: EAL domain-containing protein [Gammaproteobacteria bacterium]|nr:EAL domain-containing protein [Gammaproteobacteria bacterium]